jgi:hypothetical protein
MNSQSEPSSRAQCSVYSAENDSRDVDDAVTAGDFNRQRAGSRPRPHTRERGGGGSWQAWGQRKISTKGEGNLSKRDNGK